MSKFKELERLFGESLETSVRRSRGGEGSIPHSSQDGFGEDQEIFSYAGSRQLIADAEKACLDYEAVSGEELRAKFEFILRRMRNLTEETEEFDTYAERLLAEFEAVVSKST